MLVHDDLIYGKLSLLLPDLSDDGKIVWPLTKAIRWVYEQAGTSQRSFHLSGESSEKNRQNLENAGHWVRGEHLPSLPDLLANFSESLAAQGKTRSTPDGLIDTMPVMLALARVSTAVCKDIVDAYGTDSLYRFLGILGSYFQGIGSEVEEFKAEISGYYEIDNIVDLPDQRWQFACSHFRRHLDNKKRESSETLKKLRFASPIQPFKPDVIDALSKRLGVYPVRSNLDPILDAAGWMPDPEFLRLLNKGFEIKNRPCIEERDIVQFERDLGSSRVDDQLCWLSPWIRAIYLYRKGSFDESLCYFEQAFSSARYRAGSYQYLLVNQYLEVCAKNDRRGKFKVALGWANYAGIQVRWLQGEEQTEEAIDFAFEVFKHVTYPV
jgi:tetratricopeptide (TPR) repeat protein